MVENDFANRTELAAWIVNEGYKEHFAVANGLLNYSEGLMGNRVGTDKDSRYAHAMALLGGKAYKSYLSSVLLASQGLVEDMGIIARSLVNLCIVARWISNTDREARARRYIGWFWVEMFEMTRSVPAPPRVLAGIEKGCKSVRACSNRETRKESWFRGKLGIIRQSSRWRVKSACWNTTKVTTHRSPLQSIQAPWPILEWLRRKQVAGIL